MTCRALALLLCAIPCGTALAQSAPGAIGSAPASSASTTPPSAAPAGPATPPDVVAAQQATGLNASGAPPESGASASDQMAGGLPALSSVNATIAGVPAVIAAAARLDAARAHARQLAVGPYEITAEANYDRRFIRSVDNSPARSVNELNLIANRSFRLPGKGALDREAEHYEIVAAENNYADARHQVALSLASAWFDLVAANERVSLLRKSSAEQSDLLRAVGLRVAYKDAAKLDADRSQLEAEMVRAQLASAQTDLARARSVLSATFPTLIASVVPPAAVLLQPDTAMLTAWHDRILLDSHELRAAQAAYDQQSTLARRARLDRIPDPQLGVRVFTEQGGDEKGVGLNLSVPLPGRYRGAVADQASATAREAAAHLAEVRRQVQVTADVDLADATGQLDAYAIAKRAVGAATTAVARLEQGYRLGGVDLADLLYARRQQRDAELTEADFRAKAARAVTKLRIDAHLLWAAPDND